MQNTNNFFLAAAVAALLPVSAADAALISYNSTSNLSGLGRSADGSGQDPFVGGLGYASAGQPAYTGRLPASWYTVLNGVDSAQFSSANLPSSVNMGAAQSANGLPELTTAYHAYQNVIQAAVTNAQGVTTGYTLTPTNWGHNADFGLFQLKAASDVTITVSADNNSQLSPGFSVWQGWDTKSTSTRHGTWLNNGAPLLSPGAPAPFGSSLGAFEGTAYTAEANGSATLSLHDLAAGEYTIVLGGYLSETCNGLTCVTAGGGGGFNAEYAVSFTTTAPVSELPLPASAYLFAAGLGGIGLRRRR